MKKLILLILAIICTTAVSATCHQNANGGWINDAGTTCWEMYQGGAATTSTPAGTLDKFVASIHNCYNISITIDKLSGNYTPVTFKDCSNNGSTWTCDCHNIIGTYNLTLQTDKTPLYSDYRLYKLDIQYTTYETSSRDLSLTLQDWGDSARTFGEETTDLGSNVVVIDHPAEIRYVEINNTVNKTVYVDRVINKEIPKYIYTENTSKLAEAEASVNNYKFWNRFWFSLWIIFSLALMGYNIYMHKEYRGLNGKENI